MSSPSYLACIAGYHYGQIWTLPETLLPFHWGIDSTQHLSPVLHSCESWLVPCSCWVMNMVSTGFVFFSFFRSWLHESRKFLPKLARRYPPVDFSTFKFFSEYVIFRIFKIFGALWFFLKVLWTIVLYVLKYHVETGYIHLVAGTIHRIRSLWPTYNIEQINPHKSFRFVTLCGFLDISSISLRNSYFRDFFTFLCILGFSRLSGLLCVLMYHFVTGYIFFCIHH